MLWQIEQAAASGVPITNYGMAITYLIANRTLPGMKASNPDPRTTDDKFVIELRTSSNSQFSVDELEKMVKETGIVELEQKTI